MAYRKKNSAVLYFAALLVVLFGALLWLRNDESAPTPQDEAVIAFAQCLTDKGVKMYGAFWCPRCAEQEELFGRGWENISYIECSPNGNRNAVAQECRDANIKGYPTWVFSDESRLSGVQRLEALGNKAGCALESGS